MRHAPSLPRRGGVLSAVVSDPRASGSSENEEGQALNSTKVTIVVAAIAIAGVAAYMFIGGGTSTPETDKPAAAAKPSAGTPTAAANDGAPKRATPKPRPKPKPKRVVKDPRTTTPERLGEMALPKALHTTKPNAPAPASDQPWKEVSDLFDFDELRLGMGAKGYGEIRSSAKPVVRPNGQVVAYEEHNPGDLKDIQKLVSHFTYDDANTLRGLTLEMGPGVRGQDVFDDIVRKEGFKRGETLYFEESDRRRAMWRGPNWDVTISVERGDGRIDWGFEKKIPMPLDEDGNVIYP